MAIHPLWRPYDIPTDDEIEAVRVNAPQRGTPIEVVEADPTWPETYAGLACRVRSALGDHVLALEHVGSTAVPGLAAKPVIDIDLTVPDSADESTYVPALEAEGFVLRIREPDFEEHRLLRLEQPECHVHVWSPGAVEPARHRLFRDWLAAHEDDRRRYEAAKRDAAAVGFTNRMHYNNHKAAVVYDIYERVFADDVVHPHDPRPRA